MKYDNGTRQDTIAISVMLSQVNMCSSNDIHGQIGGCRAYYPGVLREIPQTADDSTFTLVFKLFLSFSVHIRESFVARMNHTSNPGRVSDRLFTPRTNTSK